MKSTNEPQFKKIPAVVVLLYSPCSLSFISPHATPPPDDSNPQRDALIFFSETSLSSEDDLFTLIASIRHHSKQPKALWRNETHSQVLASRIQKAGVTVVMSCLARVKWGCRTRKLRAYILSYKHKQRGQTETLQGFKLKALLHRSQPHRCTG